MVPSLRKAFNATFDPLHFQKFLEALDQVHPGAIEFRIAETPVFVPRDFTEKMIQTCEYIVDQILDASFLEKTRRAIPPADYVPNEGSQVEMIAFDFGVCVNDHGGLEPQLIEMQGFPSLYGFQVFYPELLRNYFTIPANYSHYLGGYDRESYLRDFSKLILGNLPAEHTILLEIKPYEQKTRIDFFSTRDYLGIEPVCITELIQEGRSLFYVHPKTGRKTKVERIYNRIIFDDLHAQRDRLGHFVDIRQDLDVTWAPHPNWFYRISKFTLPLLQHPYIPSTEYLHAIKTIPQNLEDYVLKPLFSFAGQGVVIDVKPSDFAAIRDPENWILQKKVRYGDVIETPDGGAKAEFRIMYWWLKGEARPKPAVNLARLSKGKMIGVRYNKDKAWVGGSVCYFER